MLMVFFTTIAGFILLNSKKENNKILLLLLLVSSVTEIITLQLLLTKQQHFIGLLYSISFPVFCFLWLLMLYKNQIKKKVTVVVMIVFILLGLINFFYFQGNKIFNYYTAVLGSLSYIVLVVYESFIRLKREDFSFILSNKYLLLLSPVLLFFGFGQMFGFVSRDITQTEVFGGFKLFDIVADFVNMVYYMLVLIYMALEKKTVANG